MSIAFTIRTTDREPGYLEQTLRNLRRGNVKQVSIAFGAAGQVKPNTNGASALRLALAQHTDWVVFLEDDIDVVDGFPEELQAWLREVESIQCGMYSLGMPHAGLVDEAIANKKIAFRMHPEMYYGSWGVAMRHEDALNFVCWLETDDNLHQSWVTPEGEKKYESRGKCFDLRLTAWHQVAYPGQRVIVAAPPLINHVGAVSSLDNNVGEMPRFSREYLRCRVEGPRGGAIHG